MDAAELEQWVSSMRKAAQAGQLTDEHRQQLTSLQFVWKPNVVSVSNLVAAPHIAMLQHQ